MKDFMKKGMTEWEALQLAINDIAVLARCISSAASLPDAGQNILDQCIHVLRDEVDAKPTAHDIDHYFMEYQLDLNNHIIILFQAARKKLIENLMQSGA